MASTAGSGLDLVDVTPDAVSNLAVNSSFTALAASTTGSQLGYFLSVVEGANLNVGHIAFGGTWLDFLTLPGSGYTDCDMTSHDQDIWVLGYNSSTLGLRLFHGTTDGLRLSASFNELDLNLTGQYLSRPTGGVRPRLSYNSLSNRLTVFAESSADTLDAITMDWATKDITVSALDQITPPPSQSPEYGANSAAFRLGNRDGFVSWWPTVEQSARRLRLAAYDPITHDCNVESIGRSWDQASSAVAASAYGFARAVVAWKQAFSGVSLDESNTTCPISTFAELKVQDFSEILGYLLDPQTGQGYVLGNAMEKLSYSTLNLANQQFAPQSPPGASSYRVSNWDKEPLSVHVSVYDPQGEILEERTIEMGAMETKEIHSQSTAIEPALTSFSATGSFNVLGSWKIGNLPTVALTPSTTSRSWTSPVQQRSDLRHAFSWSNPGPYPNACVLSLYDGNGGMLVNTFEVTLQPNEQIAKFLDEAFPGDLPAGQSFIGSAKLDCAFGVSAIGVEQNTQSNEITYAPFTPSQPERWKIPIQVAIPKPVLR